MMIDDIRITYRLEITSYKQFDFHKAFGKQEDRELLFNFLYIVKLKKMSLEFEKHQKQDA